MINPVLMIIFISIFTIGIVISLGALMLSQLVSKLFKIKTDFLESLKIFLLYDIFCLLFYALIQFVYPKFHIGFNVGIMKFLIFGALSFSAFYFITKKKLSLNWKKALTAFVLIMIIAVPTIDTLLSAAISKYMPDLLPPITIKFMLWSKPLWYEISEFFGHIEMACLNWPQQFLKEAITFK